MEYNKHFRNFSTQIHNNSFNNNNNTIDTLLEEISNDIKNLDKITDRQVYLQTEADIREKLARFQTEEDIREKLHSQVTTLEISNSLPLALKKHHILAQSLFRGLILPELESNELLVHRFISTIEKNISDRIKNLIKIKNQTMKTFRPNEVEDLPKGDDWLVKYLTKEVIEGHSLISQEYDALYTNTKRVASFFNIYNNFLQNFFNNESKEMQIITDFYLIIYYITGLQMFNNIVRNEEHMIVKSKDNLLEELAAKINFTLNIYNISKNDLDLNYKIKDFELLDENITLQSCVDCLQFLQLLLQSNGDSNSIQKVLNNFKEKHQSNHIFSFIYSMMLYYTNRMQESHDILKQLLLLVKENKALQPTTLPITTWFLGICVELNVNKEKKDIDSLKLACQESVKEQLNTMQISPPSKTASLLGSGYELTDDFENLFNIMFTILEEIPLSFTEDRLYQALNTFYQSSLQLSDKDYVSFCLASIFSRYAACFPSNVGIQYLFLEVKEKMGIMKDKNELLKEHTKLYELCNVPTEEMKKHNADMIFLPIIKQEIRKKLMTLQQTE
ncbi:hypothetical protein ABK040_005657 [Willaertia magna]